MSERTHVTIHTDGACSSNPGPGGYAAVLAFGGRREEMSGGRRLTTSNRMEMMGAIEALAALEWPSRGSVHSDSRYLVDSIMQGQAQKWRANGWKRNRKAYAVNSDLWRELLDLCGNHEVDFVWVRGHAGDPDNERCHRLSVTASRNQELPADVGYEKQLARAASQPLLFDGNGRTSRPGRSQRHVLLLKSSGPFPNSEAPMSIDSAPSLSDRLERLEDSNRRLEQANVHLHRQIRRGKRVGGLALLACVTLVLAGARHNEESKTIEAERLVIRGNDGKVYAELGPFVDSDGRTSGAARLAFFDGEGGLRTNYGVGSAHDPYLHLMDDAGDIRVSMGMSPQGWSNLSFTEKSGTTGVSIGSSNDASGVVLRGPSREGSLLKHEGALIVSGDGSARLHFFRPDKADGEDTHERVSLGVGQDGAAALVLRGQPYDSGIRALVSPDGKAVLNGDRSKHR